MEPFPRVWVTIDKDYMVKSPIEKKAKFKFEFEKKRNSNSNFRKIT